MFLKAAKQKLNKWKLVNIKRVKATQSYPTLYEPMDYTVHGILQARLLEWIAAPFPWGGSSKPKGQIQVSCIAGRFFTSWNNREAQEL